MTVGYADPGATVHSLAALLLLISLIYDIFDISQQSGVFDIVSRSNKKLVLEPYGKLKMSEDENDGDIIDKDSYCISRVSNINGFFARISKATKNVTGKLVSLVLSFSVSLCVMLVLLLTGEQIGTVVLSLVVTLSCSLICASIFESEFAFFTVHNILKKYKTGIIGKASVEEYGKCNILYFDDFNVFNKKSVRTKGLKLYDNNEIYRILYHTQAVFSKVGGPLKGVFEFATTEMIHSRNVEIKEISKEGISAVVDNRTSVLIGTGSFMKSRGIHPSYTAQDLRLEEAGEESILFIALGGSLGAKLYVTYQFSGEFEKLAKKLTACGINIGIRSSDPNINDK
jgi:cation transport ATPase